METTCGPGVERVASRGEVGCQQTEGHGKVLCSVGLGEGSERAPVSRLEAVGVVEELHAPAGVPVEGADAVGDLRGGRGEHLRRN